MTHILTIQLMMGKLFLFSLCLSASQLTAQNSFKKNTLYGEILGNGLVLSANYERQLGDKPGFGLHIGVGLGGYKPAIPLGVIYLFETGNQKSFIETGAGITLGERDMWKEYNYIQLEKNSYKPGFIPSFGYRHHTSYGFMWKVSYTPVFSSYRNIPLFFGIAAGWRI